MMNVFLPYIPTCDRGDIHNMTFATFAHLWPKGCHQAPEHCSVVAMACITVDLSLSLPQVLPRHITAVTFVASIVWILPSSFLAEQKMPLKKHQKAASTVHHSIKSLAKRDIYKRHEFLCLIFKCSALTSCKVSAVTTYSSHCCYTNSQDACLADQIVLWAIHVKESLTPRLPGNWYHYSSTLYYVYTVPPQTSLHCLSLFGASSVIHGHHYIICIYRSKCFAFSLSGFPLVS